MFIDDVETLDELLALKTRFSEVPKDTFALARVKSNPWEHFGRQGFVNRSAPKLALLDWECGLLPPLDYVLDVSRQGKEWRWVDLCGGPGGFTGWLTALLAETSKY